jgi:hemerythrin superfamily protein
MNTNENASATQAVQMLKSDHRKVDELFERFESTHDSVKKAGIVTEVCRALIVHAEIEEKLFYPASRSVLGSDDQKMVDEAFVEHASLKGLILRLDGMRPHDVLFDAYVTVLKEYVQHHVKEEEQEYFPKVEKSSLDLRELGRRMQAMNDDLAEQQRLDPAARGIVTAKLFPNLALARRSQEGVGEKSNKHAA